MVTENDPRENESQAGRHEYLWDRSGEPDAEIQKLESLLGEFRHNRPAPVFPEIVPERPWKFLPGRIGFFPALAAATVAVAVFAVVIYRVRSNGGSQLNAEGWTVSSVEGAPRIGQKAISRRAGSGRLRVGQILETGPQSSAQLQDEDTGQIEVGPNTRLRLLAMNAGLKRVALDRGTIHAYIWAPPGEFVVDTPSAMTVDLGCAYTLHVDDSGAGLVRTSLGWVGFKLHGRESFIPAGAACATRPQFGPGTPYFEDASTDFRNALARFDFADSTPEQRAGDLAVVIASARKRDALTLWHLLSRADESQRTLVFDRLEKLAPAPTGVTEAGILHLDPAMLDRWWNELGFDDISVWRYWERNWRGTSAATSGR